MRLLLGSGGFRAEATDGRRELLLAEMRRHFGSVSRILFVPYALADHDTYVTQLQERMDAGYEFDGIHRHADPRAAVAAAEGIYIGGGNTWRLQADLLRHGLLDPIRERVRAGLPYMGVSAGTNVACPTMQTTNDMAITVPATTRALGLVPFQINTHYYFGETNVKHADGSLQPHFGETRDERIAEFHEVNDTPVVGLWEGGILRVADGGIDLLGAPARIFRRGREPEDVAPGNALVV